MSKLFASGGQSIGASASASVPSMNIQGWYSLVLTDLIYLKWKGFSESSPASQFKSINSLVLSLLYGPTLTSIHDYWKNYSFDYMYFCWQNDVSAFNTLSRFVIAFLRKSKSLNFMATVTIQSSFVAQENKTSHCFHFFPFIYHEVLGPDAMTFVYWMLSFKPAFSLSSFTLIKRLFGSSLHYAIRVVSTVYLSIICTSWAPTVCQILARVQPCYTHWLFAPLWTTWM